MAELLLEGVRDREVPPEPNFDETAEETEMWARDSLTAAQEKEAMRTFRRFLLLGRKKVGIHTTKNFSVTWAVARKVGGAALS